jgi:hypothetical protein
LGGSAARAADAKAATAIRMKAILNARMGTLLVGRLDGAARTPY